MLAAGCAGPSAAAGLSGTWRGTFHEIGAYSGFTLGNITLRIDDDGKCAADVTIRLVAGSSRGSQYEMSGRVVAKGNYAVFEDSSGARVILVRSGDMLYGVLKERTTSRTVAVRLDKAGKEGQ